MTDGTHSDAAPMQIEALQAGRHAPQNARVHLDYLDGIRGAAALFVMAHHIWRAYGTVPLGGLLGLATNWLLYGHLAVDLFIVLSGFCLMLPVARSGKLRGGWTTFFKSRARRILPPVYAALALAVVSRSLRHFPLDRYVFLVNLTMVQELFPKQNILDGPVWSVAVECKIYLLFPFLVWLWLRAGRTVVLMTAAAIGALLFAILLWAGLFYENVCPWYVLLFAMGMIAADFSVHHEQIKSKWELQSLLAIAFLCFGAALYAWPVGAGGSDEIYVRHQPIIDIATGFFASTFLTVLGAKALQKKRSFTINLLAWRPLVFIGSFSYSIYLLHLILIYLFRNLLMARLPFHPAYLVVPLDMLIVCCIAYVFHILIERPFMSKHWPKTERQAEVAAIVSPAP